MPRIVAQLQGLNLYAWVTTAYMLSSTVMVPIYGKLNDIYGRKSVLISGVLIFLSGSVLCGLSGEFGRLPILGGGMTQLIVFRGLQGLGGGALFTSAFAIIADLYPPRERAKFAGMFGGVFGLASIIGPVIGGFFTDLGTTYLFGMPVAGWRWVFYVNLPVSAVALFMIVSKMPPLLHRQPGKIDLLGAGLIVATFVPLLLALSWGGRDHPWDSPLVVGLLALSAVALVAFVLVELRVANPILSMGLFRNRVFSTANAANFVTSMAFMGSLTFLPLFLQLGQGVKATTSGIAMLPLMIGMIVSSTLCGQVINRTGKYKPVMLGGSVLIMTGLFLVSRLGPGSGPLDVSWRVLIMGIGLGPSMGTFNIVVQNAVSRNQMGVATSSTQFFRQIGGTVGVAIFGAVLTTALASEAAKLPPQTGGPAHVMTLSDLQRLAIGGAGEAPTSSAAHVITPTKVDPAARAVIVRAITRLFTVAIGVAACAFALLVVLPEIPLEHRSRGPSPASESPVAPGEPPTAEAKGEGRSA
jgi:EmrB/QacA subfamily drug resistance transporter